MDAKGASVVLSLFLISETNKGKTTTMKTKLKSSIIAYHMAVGHRVAAAMVCALCAVGLSAFAEESVTINEVKSVQPWDKAKGTITVDYSLGGLDAATDYKVAFDITAGGQTASVTNDATKLTDGAATKEIDTAKLFDKQVVDTKAKVKVSLIAIKASSEPEYVVMKMGTGEGAYTLKWATMNLGAEKVTDYGYYFAWGATELAYSGLSSKKFTFVASRPVSYGGSGWTQSDGFVAGNAPYRDGSKYEKYTGTGASGDKKDKLESGDDAATALLGSGWRMPTKEEFKDLYDACGGTDTPTAGGSTSTTEKGVYWCDNYDGVKGLLFCDGTNKLFFPAAGEGNSLSLNVSGTSGNYWSSSLNSTSIGLPYNLYFESSKVRPNYTDNRYRGLSVRPVKEVK